MVSCDSCSIILSQIFDNKITITQSCFRMVHERPNRNWSKIKLNFKRKLTNYDDYKIIYISIIIVISN